MNLKKAQKTLMAVLNKKFGLDFEYSMVNGHLEGKNSIIRDTGAIVRRL